jgi:hypothetical protein
MTSYFTRKSDGKRAEREMSRGKKKPTAHAHVRMGDMMPSGPIKQAFGGKGPIAKKMDQR